MPRNLGGKAIARAFNFQVAGGKSMPAGKRAKSYQALAGDRKVR